MQLGSTDLTQYVPAVVSLVVGIMGPFFVYRSTRQEGKENRRLTLLEIQQREIEHLTKRVDDLSTEILRVRAELADCNGKGRKLVVDNDDLRAERDTWRNRAVSLQKAISDRKSGHADVGWGDEALG